MARRGWGEGSICKRTVKRGDREYVYWRAVVPGGALGNRREHQARTERAARAWLREQLADPLPKPRERVTLGAYAVDWLRQSSLDLRPATSEFYRHSLRHLDPIADLPIDAVTPAHVRALLETAHRQGKASRTIRGIGQTLRLVLRRAEADGLVDRNVAALVRLPKLETKEPQHFTAEQARRFIDAAQGDALFPLYATALGTGLRRGELLALTWRDVGDGVVTVRTGKTRAAARQIPLPAFVREALSDHVADGGRTLGPIWPYRPEYVTRHFRDLCERAGVPYIKFHGLRHSAASLLLDEGVDPLTIQAILGHSRVNMTAHYARAGEERRREAVERLGRRLAGRAEGEAI